MRHVPILFALLGALLPRTLPAQAPAADSAAWNSERALELIRRAQQRRMVTSTDTGLVNYQADARLFVYFYLDRPESGERNLVKTDQIALDVLWQAPDLTKQRIVGWRNRKSLPTNINYHLDHLTVVQENFGNEIRLGDGDEVRGVMHPAAPGAHTFYDFRLADSLTLRLPGNPEPVRVYELRVRPKDPNRPAFLGSVFVERRAGDIVRMDFTFTRSAYIDRYLDYINISLDNGLWRGRFWLPNEQRMEIRRSIPELDFPVGSVIRGTMRVGNYRFNQPLPPATFLGPKVVAAPRAQREAFPFEQEIHAEVREEGIGPQAELTQVRSMAAALVRQRALQRAASLRLSIPRTSEVLRYNRAEGVAPGLGVGLVPVPGVHARLGAGWALGAGHPLASLSLSAGAGETRVEGAAYVNRLRDVGVGPVASGAINTLSALLVGEDYLEPYHASGAALGVERTLAPSWSLRAGVRAERQRSAERVTDFAVFGGTLREVRSIDRAERFLGGEVALRRDAPAEIGRWWAGSLRMDAGSLDRGSNAVGCPGTGCDPSAPDRSLSFVRPQAALRGGRRWSPADAALELSARAGAALGELPRQELYLLGGRGTIPGFGFRAFGGDRFALLNATLDADLLRPWVRGRLFGAMGATGVGDAGRASLARWGVPTTGGLRSSVGMGLGLVHDILRVDLARGLGEGGRWELVVEANPSFWDFL